MPKYVCLDKINNCSQVTSFCRQIRNQDVLEFKLVLYIFQFCCNITPIHNFIRS